MAAFDSLRGLMDPRDKPGGDAAASGNDSRFAAVLRRSTERAFEILRELPRRDRRTADDIPDRLGVLLGERAFVTGSRDREEMRAQPVRHVARLHRRFGLLE